MTELAFLPATELAKKVRAREIGCAELLEYFIARNEKYHGKLNAIIWTDLDVARARAKEHDRAVAAGGALGPLHGVPMTIKECFALTGTPATFGVPHLRNNFATKNAICVDRMLAAGANIFGKTNVPPWLADGQSDNEIYGRTNNPWNVGRSPGGSSGGSAAAIAAGLSGIEIGSDIASSIRNPAHYCGVFGHKTTWGIAPKRGGSHDDAIADPDISVLGPLARSADDLEAVLQIVSGPDEYDAVAYRLELPKPRQSNLRDFRVALLVNDDFAEVDGEVERLLQKLGDFLRLDGAQVDVGARPDIDTREIFDLFMTMVRAATSTRLNDEEFEKNAERVRSADKNSVDFAVFALRGTTMPHREWLIGNERRLHYRQKWHEFFQKYDVLLCPPFATAAPPHMTGPVSERRLTINGKEHRLTNQLFWAGFTGLPFLPSSVAPIGLTGEGLPVGVQIVAPQYGDLTSIHFARLLERNYRAFTPPPGYA